MIKILFFIETLEGGGAEKVLRDLVNHMDQSQFDITVQTAFPCDAAKYLAPGIRYRSMYASDSKANRLRYRAEAESGLAYRLHINDDYDIECAYLEMGSTKVMAASTNKKAKKIAWVHCDLKKKVHDPEAFVKKTSGWYQKFDAVACVSENVKNSFAELFGNKPEASVIYNTIDDTAIRAKALEHIRMPEKTKLTVAAVGRLSAEKGFDRLIRVSNQLRAEGLDHELWIIGEGPERGRLESYIQSSGVNDDMKLLGFCDNPYPYLNAADIYVCSSHYEGLSTTVIEALILGKPIVTTDCGGMHELIGDSEFGLIMPNTEEGILEGVRTILADTELRRTYAARALQRGEQFSGKALAKNTEQFLISVMD